jgi:hypothetical protein
MMKPGREIFHKQENVRTRCYLAKKIYMNR